MSDEKLIDFTAERGKRIHDLHDIRVVVQLLAHARQVVQYRNACCCSCAPGRTGCVKLGQPLFDSNLSVDTNSGSPLTIST